MNRILCVLASVSLFACNEPHGLPLRFETPEALSDALPPEVADTAPLTLSEQWTSKATPPLSSRTGLVFEPAGNERISDVSSVTLAVEVTGARGPNQLTLELTAPGGVPYEVRSTLLTGSPFETQTSEFNLPVAGTLIDSSGLSGEWSGRVLIDGEPLASMTFDLKP